MSEVELTEAERQALWQARVKCTGHDTMHTLVAAVESIIAARLAAADQDTALRERVEALAAEWGARWDVPEVGVLDLAAKHYRAAAATLRDALDQSCGSEG
jgi:hypothetical protein